MPIKLSILLVKESILQYGCFLQCQYKAINFVTVAAHCEYF